MKVPSTPWTRSFVVASVALLFALLADLLLAKDGVSRVDLMIGSDVLAAFAFGAVHYAFNRKEAQKRLYAEKQERERAASIDAKMRIIADMNHHIRNALQTIVYLESLHPNNHHDMFKDAVQRIEWALTEVLPGVPKQMESSDKISEIHAPE
jgi:hypothetical protein